MNLRRRQLVVQFVDWAREGRDKGHESMSKPEIIYDLIRSGDRYTILVRLDIGSRDFVLPAVRIILNWEKPA